METQKSQAHQAELQTAVSLGTTLLNAFLGRKMLTASTVSKAATTASRAGKSIQQQADVAHADESLQSLQQQLADLQGKFDTQSQTLQASNDPSTEVLQTVTIKPRKADIAVQLVALVWMPFSQDSQGALSPAF